MHYRDNLPGGQNWTPIGGQDCKPFDTRARGDGLTTVVMFLLVPQVKLSKWLDVAQAAERWSAQLPALIEQQLRTLSCLSSGQAPACP